PCRSDAMAARRRGPSGPQGRPNRAVGRLLAPWALLKDEVDHAGTIATAMPAGRVSDLRAPVAAPARRARPARVSAIPDGLRDALALRPDPATWSGGTTRASARPRRDNARRPSEARIPALPRRRRDA